MMSMSLREAVRTLVQDSESYISVQKIIEENSEEGIKLRMQLLTLQTLSSIAESLNEIAQKIGRMR